MDHFSPVAPAHIRVLVLPVGRIERQRFLCVVRRLQTEASIISLADLPQRTNDNDFALSPGGFSRGSLLYHYSASAAPEHHESLSPFELFREPLLVLGLVDALQKDEEGSRKALEHAVAYLKERHPRVIRRQLVVLGDVEHSSSLEHVKAVRLVHAEEINDGSLLSVMCDISERFLVDFNTYAQATQASPTILTPGQTARSLQRTASLRDEEKRPGSGRSTPPNGHGVSSPTDEGSPARAPYKAPPLPATSFDQIPSVTNPPSNASRPESRASNMSKSGKRSSSQDRVSVQGFGSAATQEKIRLRGRARVGIVLGSIYMTAGQWAKALPVLVEHTTKSRTLQDSLWHAKGLENTLMCMLLLAWSGVDFLVPNICEPVIDRSGPLHAARIAAETRAAAEGTKQQLQLFRLSIAIPDLSKLILSLYRSMEGSLELPFVVIAEATVRMSRLVTALSLAKGQLSASGLRAIVIAGTGYPKLPSAASFDTAFSKAKLSKTSIADLLAQALPRTDDAITISDHIRLLSGVAATYAVLGLDRKKAITVKDLVVRLTGALIQARKLGAAEMGIHPAASLSTDTSTDTVLSIIEDSQGIQALMADVTKIYGADAGEARSSEQPDYSSLKVFGSSGLKFDLLRELVGFCEASPDPYGVLLLVTSLLRASGPKAAIDLSPGHVQVVNAFSQEEQMHLATVIHRTVAISRQLGLTDALATYWDPFVLRKVEILQPSGQRAIIDRSRIVQGESSSRLSINPGNPLLYDPNASRPGTVEKPLNVLVKDEESECIVTLQNPFDIPVDIEELEPVTEGVEVFSHHEPLTLGPLRLQRIPLKVKAASEGSVKIIACRIKMQGCRSQVFPIVEQAWSAPTVLTIKDQGLEARRGASTEEGKDILKILGVEQAAVSATIIEALPTLSLDDSACVDSGLMLLEGERRPLALSLRNSGNLPACIYDLKDTSGILRHVNFECYGKAKPTSEMSATIIQPAESISFNFEIEGKAGTSSTQVAFYYAASAFDAPRYARVATVPLDITVNAALQVQNFEVTKASAAGFTGRDELLLSYDVRNAWPKSIFFQCSADDATEPDGGSNHGGSLAPGEIRRVNMLVPRMGGQFVEDVAAVKADFVRRISVSWQMDDRSGVVDLQGLPLSSESLSLLRGAPVQIKISVAAASGQKRSKMLEFTVGSFVSVRIELVNRSKRSGPLSISLSTDGLAGSQATERSVAVVGTLQHLISPLAEGELRLVQIGLCPLLAGTLHLEAVARPAILTHELEEATEWVERASISLHVV